MRHFKQVNVNHFKVDVNMFIQLIDAENIRSTTSCSAIVVHLYANLVLHLSVGTVGNLDVNN